jgi:hypothetical protein
VEKGRHVELLGEGYAVVQLNTRLRLGVKGEALELQREDAQERREAQALAGDRATVRREPAAGKTNALEHKRTRARVCV